MANLGEATEIVNASELTLEVGADTYILLKTDSLNLHAGRPESRTDTTDAGALFTYSKGDNWFTCTLLLSKTEADSINTKSVLDTDGDMPSTAWLIKGKNISGTTITYTCTGILREWDVSAVGGKVEIDSFGRITTDTGPTA